MKHDIMRKPNTVIVLWYTFFLSEFTNVWALHLNKGLGDQADFEVDMINAISAAFQPLAIDVIECHSSFFCFLVIFSN